MRAVDYLKAYPRDLTLSQIHHGATNPEIQAAQLYSYGYGHILYDSLSGNYEGLAERASQLADYEDQVNFGELEADMLEGAVDWKYRNEVNFLGLNYHMNAMWQPLINGSWGEGGNSAAIRHTLDGLALEGLIYYHYRENYLQTHGDMAFRDRTSRLVFSRLEGAMQENDATIAAVNWAESHPDLTVVLAPAQFEHSAWQANADLIVVNTVENRAIGVQVKTRAGEHERNRYDTDRIVVVDSEDLGNIRVFSDTNNEELHRPWPGIIAVSRVLDIRNQDYGQYGRTERKHIIRRKTTARQLLGNLKVDYQEVSRTIGAKILEKL
jgi:hypothetical protein